MERHLMFSCIRTLNVAKLAILPKSMYRLNTISVKNLSWILAEIDRLILKFLWKSKRPRINKTILKKTKVGRLTVPDFRTNDKATLTKAGYTDLKADI